MSVSDLLKRKISCIDCYGIVSLVCLFVFCTSDRLKGAFATLSITNKAKPTSAVPLLGSCHGTVGIPVASSIHLTKQVIV